MHLQLIRTQSERTSTQNAASSWDRALIVYTRSLSSIVKSPGPSARMRIITSTSNNRRSVLASRSDGVGSRRRSRTGRVFAEQRDGADLRQVERREQLLALFLR